MPQDDVKILNDIRTSLNRQTVEMAGLKEQLQTKTTLLETAVREKSGLEAELEGLRTNLRQKEGLVQSKDQELVLLQERLQQRETTQARVLAEKDAELAKWKGLADEVTRTSKLDDVIVREWTNTKLQYEELNRHYTSSLDTLEEAISRASIGEDRTRRLDAEIANLTRVVAESQMERAAARSELEILRGKVQTSYTADELSGSLNEALTAFNSQPADESRAVRYVINGMDVDLKAQVYKDDQSRMRFAVADLGMKSENGLSSIKLSIRAVPTR